MYSVASMLRAIANAPPQPVVAPPVRRNTEKARAAKKEVVRKWFKDNMKDETWPTTLIASRRGQDSTSCLPLLYDLEEEGFIQRAGLGERTGRGKLPILWKLTNP